MRILIATGIYPPQIGGPATYSKLLNDELPNRGIDVVIASFGDYVSKPRVIRHFLYFFELLKKGKGVDFIYAQDPVSVGVPVVIASFFLRKKFFLKIVGDYAWEQGVQRFGVKDNLDIFSTKKQYPVAVLFLKKIEKCVAKRAYKIITPSQYLKTIIGNWGVDVSKITVIYNGFHCDEIVPTKESLRQKYSLSGTVLVSVGRLVPWKGFDVVIDGFSDIVSKISDVHLVIIGDGPDETKLKRKVEQGKLSNKVRFTGRLNQQDLFEYLKASDVFVLNTEYEGFSHIILEAMAIGVPVVTTAVGGNVEIITDGETGFLHAFNDKVVFVEKVMGLINDEANKNHIVEQAKKKVSHFTDTRMLKELTGMLNIYFPDKK